MKKEIELRGIEESSFYTKDNEGSDSWIIETIYVPHPLKLIQMYIEDYEGEDPKYYTITDLNVVAGETEKDNTYTVSMSFRDATKKEILEYKEQK